MNQIWSLWVILQTGRCLGDRFREHLRTTRLTDSDLPIGCHFASSDHSVGDMLVSIIRSGFQSALDRRRFEAKVIFQHQTLHPGDLNTDFNFIENLTWSLHARVTYNVFVVVFLTLWCTCIFSCFQSTEEEGEPSKCLDLQNLSVHILNKTFIVLQIQLCLSLHVYCSYD